jgi:hypothetical protein
MVTQRDISERMKLIPGNSGSTKGMTDMKVKK